MLGSVARAQPRFTSLAGSDSSWSLIERDRQGEEKARHHVVFAPDGRVTIASEAGRGVVTTGTAFLELAPTFRELHFSERGIFGLTDDDHLYVLRLRSTVKLTRGFFRTRPAKIEFGHRLILVEDHRRPTGVASEANRVVDVRSENGVPEPVYFLASGAAYRMSETMQTDGFYQGMWRTFGNRGPDVEIYRGRAAACENKL